MNKVILAFLSYFQIFASTISALILTLMPSLVTYKQYVMLISIITALALGYNILKYPRAIKNIVKGGLVVFVFFILYNMTQLSYDISSDKYNSFFLVLYGQTLPAVLLGSYLATKADVQLEIKRLAPLFGTLFTLIAAFTVFFTTTTTSAGYIDSENGLNYQSTSYLAAYSVGLLLYYYSMKDSVKWFSIFNNQWVKRLLPLMIFLDFISCLIAGGRGGFVLLIAQIILFIYYMLKHSKSSLNKKPLHLFFFILIGIFGYFSVRYAAHSTIETSGYERILGAIRDVEDTGRSELREKAIQTFNNSPIYGHGIGSVFYEIGEYTHNCFTDILVEAGLIGLTIFVIILFKCYKKSKKLIRSNFSDYFWVVILLNGFIMSLFSGYYIAIIPIWWVMSFIFFRKA